MEDRHQACFIPAFPVNPKNVLRMFRPAVQCREYRSR